MAALTRARSIESSPLYSKFAGLCKSAPEAQCEFFLKSFIFALGDKWKEVPELCSQFTKHARATGPSHEWMGQIQAADFLQKHEVTRTGLERRKEVEDIGSGGKIVFIEYLLLHYKAMILKEYYARLGEAVPDHVVGDAIGLVGCGALLLDELFAMPEGLSPELEASLEQFTEDKKQREARVQDLEAKAAKGGVKGMAAKNELIILDQADKTELNRIEITLKAAQRKAGKQSGAEAVAAVKKKEEQAKKEDHARRRASMKERASMFEKKQAAPGATATTNK